MYMYVWLNFRYIPQAIIRAPLDSQAAGNYRPLYPKVDHYWFKVAHNSEPLALQAYMLEGMFLNERLWAALGSFWAVGNCFGHCGAPAGSFTGLL